MNTDVRLQWIRQNVNEIPLTEICEAPLLCKSSVIAKQYAKVCTYCDAHRIENLYDIYDQIKYRKQYNDYKIVYQNNNEWRLKQIQNNYDDFTNNTRNYATTSMISVHVIYTCLKGK